MRKISVHGFYGAGNLGDEAILEALLAEIRAVGPYKVHVLAEAPETVRATHGVASACFGRRRRSIPKCLWHVATSDLFLLGGGGLLKDYGPDATNVKSWLPWLRFGLRLGVPTALVGMGVENIRHAESSRILPEILNRVDLIQVRDEDSKQRLEALGVTRRILPSADLALLHPPPPKPQPAQQQRRRRRVLVALRHWFDEGSYVTEPHLNRLLLETVQRVVQSMIRDHDTTVEFFPFRTEPPDDDRLVAKEVASKFAPQRRVVLHSATPTVREFMMAASRADLIIGMRLHSLILGAVAGAPLVGLAYMPKVRSFMSQMGLSETCVNLDADGLSTLPQVVSSALAEREHLRQLVQTSVSTARDRARTDLREVLALVR